MALFILGAIFAMWYFDKRSALFVTLCQWVPYMKGGFSYFHQAPLLDISGYITCQFLIT